MTIGESLRCIVQVGDIFIFRKAMSIYHHLDGCTGLILALLPEYGQYKAQVGNKILWIPIESIEKIEKKV